MQVDEIRIKKSADFVKKRIPGVPDTGLILGTALGEISKGIRDGIEFDYSEIPGFLLSTVDSHAGKLIYGNLSGKNVLCMSGRFHYYEGYDFNELQIPVRFFKEMGIKNLIITNAAGAINTEYKPGDLMIINDHINFSQASPTRGRAYSGFGPRFFDMSRAYDPDLIRLATDLSGEIGLKVHKGVYAYALGPQFETPAEIKFYRMAGCDAVGMSTVPEVIVAAQLNIPVLAISLLTNMAAGIGGSRIDGAEVDETGKKTSSMLIDYIKLIVKNI